MSVDHARAEDSNELPVRTPQQELRRKRVLEELEPTTEDLFAGAAREYLSAIGGGNARLSRRGGTA
ncbi:hypothetical protein ACGFYQ_34085 [Streptomyces sp. NPDC048258]|uniref:hypothetical protein n=1 Tax=Streptomyces sp. NPDC048258 TaxID=3365527 RepID=UPI00371A41A1